MADRKIRLVVLYGGRSGEHDVSCNSAASILTHLDKDRYDILPVRIGRDGVWTFAPGLPELPTVEAAKEWVRNGFPAAPEVTAAASMLAAIGELIHYDVVLPALHGQFGEDGSLQALLDGFEVPYVGSGVAASALAMDKEHTKKIAAGVGVPVADGVVLRDGQYEVSDADRERLGLPVFVKPAREGSSIGVSRVDSWDELATAIDQARKSDDKVLVEEAVLGQEVDISVLERPGGELAVSPPMELLPSARHQFFDYEAKYEDAETVFEVPAKIDPAAAEAIGQDALKVFRALGCAGLLRADFFVRPDGSHVFNEVNTFPGFTSMSQYPRMWAAAGLPYGELLDVLIDAALWQSKTA